MTTAVAPFKNQHLSYSRLSRFETCPLSYRLHYIEKKQAEPGLPLRFGKTIHAVLERLIKEVVDDERTGPLSEERAIELYREAWGAEQLTGMDVFAEGLAILRRFIAEQGVVDHRDVLAIEKEFRLPVGPFEVLGFIDRVDWIDDETVEVIDYKTNHQLFTRDEVETSLQMSLYEVAVRRLWPWAKKVKLTFWMLRHGVRQETTRTEEQLADALAYVETLGRQTETATEYPARLNTNCSYCDHRKQCPAYADALKGKREFIVEDLADLEGVAREREEVARLAKALYARKEELEDILKAQLKERDELVLGGVRYRMFATTSLDYPLEPTLSLLGDATGLSRDEVLGKLGAIDKKALDALLKSLGKKLDKPRVSLLKAELEAHADKRMSPRLWAKEVA
jgi:RecB family exonuclease